MKRIIITNTTMDVIDLHNITDDSIVGVQRTLPRTKAFLRKESFETSSKWGVYAKEKFTLSNEYCLKSDTCKELAKKLIQEPGKEWKLFLFENENEFFKWMSED